jgi:hypothetical protein
MPSLTLLLPYLFILLELVIHIGPHFMPQHNRRTRIADDNVVNFARLSRPDSGATALDLVYQAAEVFSGMEAHAREVEARAQSLCASASERLRYAETRIEAAERSRREIMTEADCKLQDASKALRQAELQITAAEDKATAAEVRAQLAEARAQEASEALALVEEAIRRRLLCASLPGSGKLSAVA